MMNNINVFGQPNGQPNNTYDYRPPNDDYDYSTIASQGSVASRSVVSKASWMPLPHQHQQQHQPYLVANPSSVVEGDRHAPPQQQQINTISTTGTSKATRKTNVMPEDAYKTKPATLPPIKKKTSKVTSIGTTKLLTTTKQKVTPGRLFLRMSLEEDQHLKVGNFSVNVKLSVVDSEIVEKVAKKLEQRNNDSSSSKKKKKAMNVVVPKIVLAYITVEYTPTGQIIWSSEPGVNFVGGASTYVSQSEDVPCQEHFIRHHNIQTIDTINQGKSDVIIRGHLSHGIYHGELHKNSPRYALILRKHPVYSQCLNLSLIIEGEGDSVDVNQSHVISSNTTPDDIFMGFGHRLSKPNAKGMEVRVSNSSKKGKHGFAVDNIQEGGGGGGGSSGSNLVVPHFVTASGASFFLTTTEPSVFDLQHDDWYSVRVQSSILKGTWIAASSALEAMSIHSSLQGRVQKLPMWTRNGVMLGLSGGDSTVRDVHNKLKMRHCPISGVMISDWTGMKPKSNRMWYNWVLERELYPNFSQLVDELENEGINVGLYINPCIDEIPPHLRTGRRYIFREAEENGFLVKKADMKCFYNVGDRHGRTGIVDMTNQDAVNWFKKTIISNELLGAGASFWMADTNVDAPLDAKYSSNPDGGRSVSVVNVFSQEFAKVNKDAIRDTGREGDSFSFVNSGSGETSKYSATSLTDHVTNLHGSSDGGMKAALNGIVNGGISGFALGHCAISMVVPTKVGSSGLSSRSREMICRWMEMMAFTTYFRTHDGVGSGKSSKSIISAYDDDQVLDQLTRWAKVYTALAQYRQQLQSEASFEGWPVVRHPMLHYPSDEHFQEEDTSSFMLGTSMFIAPVMKPGVTKARVYLPKGEWGHLWTGLTRKVENGDYFDVPAPIGEPPVFYSTQCPFMNELVWNLQQQKIVVVEKKNEKAKKMLTNPFRKKENRDF
jgi:alpha-glucosidase